MRGHAIEVRINAEDAAKGFAPSPGTISALTVPGGAGVRFDHMLYSGYTVPPFYDSMLGKLIVWDEDRPRAIQRLVRALGELTIDGIATTKPLHLALAADASVLDGRFHTGWLEPWLAVHGARLKSPEPPPAAAVAAAPVVAPAAAAGSAATVAAVAAVQSSAGSQPGGVRSMTARYSYGGDDHIFVEVDEEMSLEAFFKSLSITNGVRDAKIKGVTEICPANASLQIKFDPDVISPADMMAEMKRLEEAAGKAAPVIKTRIIEIPVYYQDPWTHETLMRFRERHQNPQGTDIEYAAKVNNLDGPDAFVKAHSGAPWFVSMVGFVAGLPFLYQMVERQAAARGAEVSPPPHRYAEAHRRPWWLLWRHLLGARSRRLPDVRHHPDADLRPQPADQLPARLHVPVQTGRHRQVEADRPHRL